MPNNNRHKCPFVGCYLVTFNWEILRRSHFRFDCFKNHIAQDVNHFILNTGRKIWQILWVSFYPTFQWLIILSKKIKFFQEVSTTGWIISLVVSTERGILLRQMSGHIKNCLDDPSIFFSFFFFSCFWSLSYTNKLPINRLIVTFKDRICIWVLAWLASFPLSPEAFFHVRKPVFVNVSSELRTKFKV